MLNGLDKYRLRGKQGVHVSRETASSNVAGASVSRKAQEVATKISGTETASGQPTSATGMSLGGLTEQDIVLNYIGGSSNQLASGQNTSGVPQQIYKYYDAMFREDSVCGAAIELRANIPYGDFTLTGVDKAKLQVYEEAVDNMRLRTLMPRIAIERDVQGAFLGLLDWNSTKRTYDSMLSYSRQHVSKIIYPLVQGMDPVVDLEVSSFLADIATSDDPRTKDIKACIPRYLLQGAKGGSKQGIPVPMDSIVWIDRPHTDPRFNSILHRILPIFLIERALTRGTIEAAHRRQRGILHIVVGNGDLWLATPEEMSGVAELFNNADADPLGAIVVTREGISPNEVRNPTDFWRVTDSFEQTVSFKMRAMGISEAFLSGDASYNNQENAISTFLQTVKQERLQVTDQLMYRKIFPQIAEARGFKLSGREKGEAEKAYAAFKSAKGPREMAAALIAARGVRRRFMGNTEYAANASNSLINMTVYDTPKVAWKQSLMPEGDQTYVDLLNTLADHGVPAPIRTMFAAGGLDFDAIINNAKQDLQDREALKEYADEIHALRPKMAQPDEGEGGEGNGGGSEFGSTAPIGILNRAYEDREMYEPYTELSDGTRSRPTTSLGKRILRDRQTKEAAHALARVADTHNRRIKQNGEFED